MTNLLDDLFYKYHADKTPRIKHHYSQVYYDLFKDRREEIENVLEIGVAEGASLYAWRDFFPNANIWGADNDFYRVFKAERIKVFQCDQGRAGDLESLMINTPALDIVIDDGSHNPKHQIDTCLKLMSILNTDVTYIIEDVDDKSVDMIMKKLDRYNAREIHVGDRHDDRLIIVKHK